MQNLQNPEVLKKPFCDTGDKNTIPSAATGSQLASLEEGFPQITQEPTESGGIPPERADFNGIFNLLSKQNFAVQNGWLPTFNTEVSNAIGGYAEGACLWYMPTSGTYEGQVIMLKSLIGNNTYDFRADPDGYIGTYWEIVTSAGSASFPLLTFMNADHILNDSSWLRADTFSWQSGAVYKSAYKHLEDDINGITAQTETVAGTTITFYRAADDHKIVLADQEANVEAIYQATGIAWYFILDTTNERFKLPRNKYGFTGYRGHAGNYVAPTLPNITGRLVDPLGGGSGTWTGAFSKGARDNSMTTSAIDYDGYIINFDASLSSSIYQTGATVQPPAVQTYLYFYVGNTVQNETTVYVGGLTDAVNGKADTDLANLTASGKNLGSSLGKPNNSRSELLTIGASTTRYTAPCNGWYMANMKCSAAGGWVNIIVDGSLIRVLETAPFAGNWVTSLVPVLKGETVRLEYGNVSTAAGDAEFRFYYDVGAE